MRAGLCVPGHDGLIGPGLLFSLRAIGVEVARIDQASTPQRTATHATELLEAGLTPLVIVRTLAHVQRLPAGTEVEVENEPDLPDHGGVSWPARGPMRVSEYLALAEAVAEARPDLPLWGPAISNLNARGFAFLEAVIPHLPARMGVSVHRYPHGRRATVPHPGYVSREAEVEILRRLIGARPWSVTEFGYHTTTHRRVRWLPGWVPWNTWHWTEIDVAFQVAWEWAFWARQGATYATLYQLNDGPTDQRLDRYGLRDLGGRWKPVAGSFPPTENNICSDPNNCLVDDRHRAGPSVDVTGHPIDGP